MPRTIRRTLLDRAHLALTYIDSLDIALYEMSELAAGRQPAITELAPLLIELHEQLRMVWKQLQGKL